jgi:hypothetical protein
MRRGREVGSDDGGGGEPTNEGTHIEISMTSNEYHSIYHVLYVNILLT